MAITHPIQPWRERCVLRILCFIAKLVAEDVETKKAIQDLANHLSSGY